MPPRTSKKYHEDREKKLIRASQLLNRLEKFALGECEMTSVQVQAAKIFIGKFIPDLKAIELSGDPDAPLLLKWLE